MRLVYCAVLVLACCAQTHAEPVTATLLKEIPSPDQAVRLAADDLNNHVPPERHIFTRYLALWTIPPAERIEFLRTLKFWLGSLNYKREFSPIAVVGGGQLVRIDLGALEWDYYSRFDRLARYEKYGATFTFKDDAERLSFIDIWERIAAEDLYFRTNRAEVDYQVVKELKTVEHYEQQEYRDKNGKKAYRKVPKHQQVEEFVEKEVKNFVRGWTEPLISELLARMTHSNHPVMRADQFVAEVCRDPLYSAILMLPDKEADLYKVFGVDPAFLEKERGIQGGAIVESIVALHNRGLELLPSTTGYTQQFIWRTYDTDNNVGDQNVRQRLRGTLVHQGREIIGTLPNGLHWYKLYDGGGNTVADVPTTIAQDKRDPYDARVINAYKCVHCHGPGNGINAFDDVIRKMILGKDTAVAVYEQTYGKANALKAALEDYYLSNTGQRIRQHQEAYVERVKAVNGRGSEENSRHSTNMVNRYVHHMVDLDQACLELGIPTEQAAAYLKASGHEDLLGLLSGVRIARDAFEQAYSAGMLGRQYSWERSAN